MANEKVLDQLTLDMRECEKAGYGCHYGKWKAMQKPVTVEKEKRIPDGWRVCENCGEAFKPNQKHQRFCDVYCQRRAYDERVRKQTSRGERQ